MTQHDAFQGTPWNAEPTERWNQPPYWDEYYAEVMSDRERPYRREWVVFREMFALIRMLALLRAIPGAQPGPGSTFLDAGCGISLIPRVLAYWGFRVTAVDICGRAIEVAGQQSPGESELARCIPVWEPDEENPRVLTLVEDPGRSLRKLQRYKASGGSVRHVACDWHDPCLPPGTFDLIYCRNSLRCSTKPYWRRSLARFHQLLAPGGVLLLETVNAIGIQDEVEELLREGGFVDVPRDGGHPPPARHVLDWWPTG